MKIKPRAGEAGFFLYDDDPKDFFVESVNRDDICSCIYEKRSRDFHEGGDSEHYWDITKMKHDGAVEAKFSCYNREPKAKSEYMEKLEELFHRKSRGTELDLLTLAPTEPFTAFSGETSDQTFASGRDSEHYWDIMKMMRDGSVEAMFSCYNRAVQSAYMEDICSCIYQNDRSAVTTSAPLVSISALADDRSAVTTTAPLVSIPAVAATSQDFDGLPVHIVYVIINVAITLVLTGFIKGPVKNLWDCIVSKIRQFLRRSSDHDQPEEEEMMQISSDRDQPEEEEMIQISPDRDQPEEEKMFINVSKPSVKSSTNVNLTVNINIYT